MKEPSFWDKWEWARAHQKPEPKLTLDNSRAAQAPMTSIPSGPIPNLASSINDPAAGPPSDTFLEFDPHGPNKYLTGLLHPLTVSKAKALGEEADRLTRQLYPDDPIAGRRRHNDQADAFRHAYWNYEMTKAFGADRARNFSNAYEISHPNPEGERRMDLYNNQIGRELAQAGDGLAIETIQGAIARGITRNSPYGRGR